MEERADALALRGERTATINSELVLSQCHELCIKITHVLERLNSLPNSDCAVVLSEVALALEIWLAEVHFDHLQNLLPSRDPKPSPLQSTELQIVLHLTGALSQAIREMNTIESELYKVHFLGVSLR